MERYIRKTNVGSWVVIDVDDTGAEVLYIEFRGAGAKKKAIAAGGTNEVRA